MIKCNIEKSVQPPDVTRLICIMQNNLFSMGSKFFQTIEEKLYRKLLSQIKKIMTYCVETLYLHNGSSVNHCRANACERPMQ